MPSPISDIVRVLIPVALVVSLAYANRARRVGKVTLFLIKRTARPRKGAGGSSIAVPAGPSPAS